MKLLIVLLLVALAAADWDDHFDDDDNFGYQPAFYRASSRGRSVFYSADSDEDDDSAEVMTMPGAVQYSAPAVQYSAPAVQYSAPAVQTYSSVPSTAQYFVGDFDDDRDDDDDRKFVYTSHNQPAVQTYSGAVAQPTQFYSSQPAVQSQYYVREFDDDRDDDRNFVFSTNSIVQPAVQSYSAAQPAVQSYIVSQPAVQSYSVSQPAVSHSYSVATAPKAVVPFFYTSGHYVQPTVYSGVPSSQSFVYSVSHDNSFENDK